jgi:hypothetical protein
LSDVLRRPICTAMGGGAKRFGSAWIAAGVVGAGAAGIIRVTCGHIASRGTNIDSSSCRVISLLTAPCLVLRAVRRFLSVWIVECFQRVRLSYRGRVPRRQFISQCSSYRGSHGAIVEAVGKIVGPFFWSFGGLRSVSNSELLLKFARLGEMPCSGVTQEIGSEGIAYVPRHFKAAFGLVAMMARVVHRAMLPQSFVLVLV